MSTTVGKLRKGELYVLEEISEEQPVDYDKLISYLSFQGDVITTHNFLEDINLHNFNTWSGNNYYWKNITQDGTFLGNPIYRVEQYNTIAKGYFYKYNISGLEHIQDVEEYVLTALFKSSNSNESLEPLTNEKGPYQGGGNPWTTGNYTEAYWFKTYKYYLGNGWWRYIYIFKIDRNQITNATYRDKFYFGFEWDWSSAGQYVWATQPQLYLGTSKKIYQGIKTSYNMQGLRQYNDGISFEQPITNQISISNMESYDIGYTGNVCGFNNNFDSRFGAGNWSREIIYQDNIPIPWLTKAQRIITKTSGWGGWTSSNIGNTSGNIVYGVLLRLHYGEIQFGDLNTSNRLYINESYYQQHNKKLGEWIWQVGRFNGSSGGRHLYQYGPTKADIQQVQIYNTDQLLSYVDGSESVSYLELPVDQFNMFKDEITVSFIYEPLSDITHGSYPTIFTLNWWTSDTTRDWFGIYRGNNWGSQDSITFYIADGTRHLSYGKSVTGINSRIGHKLFITMSVSTTQHKFFAYVRDLTTGEDLLEYERDIDPAFRYDLQFDYQRLGFLNLASDQQNQKFSHFHFFHKYFDKQTIKKLIPRVFGINKEGAAKLPKLYEPENLLERYGPTQFETGEFGGIWDKYTQTDCQVYIVPRPFKKNKYSYFIKRTPNADQSDGKDYNWGGLKLVFPDDGTWEEGQTYKLRFWYKGYSTNTIEIYFCSKVGWCDQGVGLNSLYLPSITHSFTDEDGWQYYEQTFTIPEGFIYQTGTDDKTYYCMREFKIGYSYTNTDEYGTRLYINDLVIEKISDANAKRNTYGIKNDGIYTAFVKEDSGLTRIYLVGTQFQSSYPENRTTGNRILRINDTEIYNTSGRGLRLTVFDSSFNVISDTTYDVYGDDTQRTNLANQLAQITRDQYWQLTSFDQVNTNTNLTNQLQQMGSQIWPLSYRSPYQQFGKGQQIIYEDGAQNTQNYVSKQVINFMI